MKSDRRTFLKTTAFVAAGLGTFPNMLKAGVSSNEKLTVGLIGCNGQGFTDIKAFLNQPGVECAALCDVDQNVLRKRAAQVEKMQYKKPLIYSDFRKLIENKDIDVVINATPDHWHCLPTVYACQAGKDVYTESPLANSVQECNVMAAAQKRYGSVVQVGQWQRSEPHWNTAAGFLQSGKIGNIKSIRAWSYGKPKVAVSAVRNSKPPVDADYDFWLGPAPERAFDQNRFHSGFRWYWDYSGGLLTDSGVHLLDYVLYAMNREFPESVIATGGNYAFQNFKMETPDTMMAVYDFGDFTLLWDHATGFHKSSFNRGQGVAFIGEKGTLVIDKQRWEIMPEIADKNEVRKGYDKIVMHQPDGHGLNLHVQNFLHCVKTREKPNCSIETGAHAAKMAQMGNISYRVGRKVFWNANKQEFFNDGEANRLLNASYRKPWHLPVI